MTNVIDKTAKLATILLELQYRDTKHKLLSDELKHYKWDELCNYGIKLLTEIKEIK